MIRVGNYVGFIGRITKDPELKTVGETTVCNFCLARNRDYAKDKEHPEADFVDCVAWGKTAEFVSKYFSKGSRMGVAGSLQTRTYENNMGNKVKVTEIFVESVEFVDAKSNNSNNNNGSKESYTPPQAKPAENENESVETDDDDLPF